MAELITYAYKARNIKGRTVTGRLMAESQSGVLSILTSKGLSPIEIEKSEPLNIMNRPISIFSFSRKVSTKDLAIMTRQLATMVAASLPLAKALQILANQTDNKTLANALAEVHLDVQSGVALSVALQRRSTVFPLLMTSLVRAGETGGFLDRSLDSTAKTFESDAKLQASIKSAMTYPIAVLSMAIFGVIVMLIFIVPIFEKMFSDFGGQLPWPTQLLVTLSPIALWSSPVLVISAIVFRSWWTNHKNDVSVRKIIDPFKLKIPIFGNLFTKIAIARFSRNFSSMIGAGVPIMQSLAVVGQTSGNLSVEKAVSRIQESVRLGTTVSRPMTLEPLFPTMVTNMISVGENAGSLESMLSKIADFYDADIEATTAQLTALIEPLMIAFIGLIIGGMIITLYLPIFTIFSVIR
ncbi:MAG: hypothetical protein RLZZ426_326 [Actinomycetota bacterium]